MGMIVIKPEALERELQKVFQEIPHNATNAVDKAANRVSNKAVKQLKATSPKHCGRYAEGWGRKRDKAHKVVVYNKRYQLTHLLENGHNIVKKGKVVGFAPARVHIKPVEEMVQEEFPIQIEKMLDKELGK